MTAIHDMSEEQAVCFMADVCLNYFVINKVSVGLTLQVLEKMKETVEKSTRSVVWNEPLICEPSQCDLMKEFRDARMNQKASIPVPVQVEDDLLENLKFGDAVRRITKELPEAQFVMRRKDWQPDEYITAIHMPDWFPPYLIRYNKGDKPVQPSVEERNANMNADDWQIVSKESVTPTKPETAAPAKPEPIMTDLDYTDAVNQVRVKFPCWEYVIRRKNWKSDEFIMISSTERIYHNDNYSIAHPMMKQYETDMVAPDWEIVKYSQK